MAPDAPPRPALFGRLFLRGLRDGFLQLLSAVIDL